VPSEPTLDFLTRRALEKQLKGLAKVVSSKFDGIPLTRDVEFGAEGNVSVSLSSDDCSKLSLHHVFPYIPTKATNYAAPLAAATTFWAASVRPSAVMILRPLSWRSSLPWATLVPSRRTTRGTRKSISS